MIQESNIISELNHQHIYAELDSIAINPVLSLSNTYIGYPVAWRGTNNAVADLNYPSNLLIPIPSTWNFVSDKND